MVLDDASIVYAEDPVGKVKDAKVVDDDDKNASGLRRWNGSYSVFTLNF